MLRQLYLYRYSRANQDVVASLTRRTTQRHMRRQPAIFTRGLSTMGAMLSMLATSSPQFSNSLLLSRST